MIECSILNRLRGTGLIKSFGIYTIFKKTFELKLVWNHVYALYLALIFGITFMSPISGLLVFTMYLIGESKGWGEWVGALTRWEPWDETLLERQYLDNEGKGFPFIHQIANTFIKENISGDFNTRLKQYFRYCTLAIALRGMFWWGLVYFTLALLGNITYTLALGITLILGILFPLACFIGKYWDFKRSFGVLHLSRGWENQEIVYGLFQGITLWYVILQHI